MRGNTFSAKIAYRYLTSRRSEAFISILTYISAGALAIGVAVLILAMSIMNGFEHELKSKLLGTNAHITVRSLSGAIYGWEKVIEVIDQQQGIQSVSPFVYQQALMQHERRSAGVLIRGIMEDSAAGTELGNRITRRLNDASIFGNKKTNTDEVLADDNQNTSDGLPGIIIGRELARTLLLNIGDSITILSPQVQPGPFGLMPRFRRFQITGVYESGLVEYENTLVYVDLAAAQNFFRMGSAVSGLEVRINNINQAVERAAVISDLLAGQGVDGFAEPWTESHRGLWEALQLERLVYFIVLTLLVIMASFSIVSTLVMLVLEKRKDIAVLRTLGATRAEIAGIFRACGMIIGIFGTTVGVILGALGCWALLKYGFPLPENVFPVSTVPVRFDPLSTLITAVLSIIICYLATIYPAWRAAGLRPTELLRYE